MTKSQKLLIRHALVLACNAKHELRQAADGTTTVIPTADQLDSVLSRMSSIINTLESVRC